MIDKMKIVIENYFKSECDINTSIKDAFEKGFKLGVKKGASADVALLHSIPTADVRPVTRGEWIDHQEGRWIYAKCSECGTVHDVKSNFCPNCGADMREVS